MVFGSVTYQQHSSKCNVTYVALLKPVKQYKKKKEKQIIFPNIGIIFWSGKKNMKMNIHILVSV